MSVSIFRLAVIPHSHSPSPSPFHFQISTLYHLIFLPDHNIPLIISLAFITLLSSAPLCFSVRVSSHSDLAPNPSVMVDLSHKVLDPEDMNTKGPEAASSSSSDEVLGLKKCADCGTSRTPLWRGGPTGPKSLCNACGIRSRKKRRAILGLNRSEEKKSKKTSNDCLNQRLLAIGREVLTQRSSMDKRMRKLGEEEQAAVLLMAISCGSVYG